ncbi:DUF1045 domain-containing protein [Pseudogemmobacter bohemicus]|uniref:DUF1045 domain-containing protein n=1 Tax=Pseudogemmobacter bohemicus TaxID=2250708 RepID=UPI000DD4D77C|nr:DUF1045 domain-containing protein [Pseudogemmobacter bohemicus]
MSDFTRYAVYYAPRPGGFAARVAGWLGWDPEAGRPIAFEGPEGLPRPQAELTMSPRKYGFHGTIKAPFRLADGAGQADLSGALATLAGRLAPVGMPGLELRRLGGFLALVPEGDESALMALGAEVVTGLDGLRAELTGAEIARRRPERLNPRQRELLASWGYPFVMEEFRFHLTLSDDLPEAEAADLAQRLGPWLGPDLPRPFIIEDLCLFGEDAAGRFHLMERHALTG